MRVAVLFCVLFTAVYGLQLGEVSMSDVDEYGLTGNDVLDQLQKLVTQARDSPVTDFPALLKEAQALASKLSEESKQTLLQVFVTMRVRVTQEVETLTKEIEDTKIIINARIAEKELRISKLRDEMLQLQRKYEENQAQRLRELETIKKVRALLIKIMDSVLEVKVTREETVTNEKKTTTEETNTSEKQRIATQDGKTVANEHSSTSSSSASSTSSSSSSSSSSSHTLQTGSSSASVSASSSSTVETAKTPVSSSTTTTTTTTQQPVAASSSSSGSSTSSSSSSSTSATTSSSTSSQTQSGSSTSSSSSASFSTGAHPSLLE